MKQVVIGKIVSGKISSILDDSRLSISDTEFRQLREFIHAHTGIALSEHKKALVCSRLAKRLRHHDLHCYADYYQLLVENDPGGTELMAMINSITTNKTDFFREPHHFQFLTERVFPAWRQNPHRERPLRIWSAAASTGEEAYSIAMTALEAMHGLREQDVSILATDIDTDVLARAAAGVYTENQAAQIPRTLLCRYFLKGAGAHQGKVMVKPALTSRVHFHWLNLVAAPWPMQEKFDVIFCRNVLIYFDKPTQQGLFERFAGALKKDGYLMLGHSEVIHGQITQFKPVGHSIYQRTGGA